KSVQLVAGRVGQEYNIRKKRKGAFWEDRHHATVVDSKDYLIQCMVYIDLNMVRAGVVRHPKELKYSGYNEIVNPKDRYAIIDRRKLMTLLRGNETQQLL
ncbi:MAG: transposase, partial [Proteobacteria bacterium]|nr:transposase [Pseudomonadota bacterium]